MEDFFDFQQDIIAQARSANALLIDKINEKMEAAVSSEEAARIATIAYEIFGCGLRVKGEPSTQHEAIGFKGLNVALTTVDASKKGEIVSVIAFPWRYYIWAFYPHMAKDNTPTLLLMLPHHIAANGNYSPEHLSSGSPREEWNALRVEFFGKAERIYKRMTPGLMRLAQFAVANWGPIGGIQMAREIIDYRNISIRPEHIRFLRDSIRMSTLEGMRARV